MLSGWGTKSPNHDFKPLIDELKNNFKVVVLEYFGYGSSDETTTSRTNENICDEIHIALGKLGVKSPYVLVLHSMSGLHALYFVSKFPNEVKAIVGIDMSLPQKQIERWSGKNTFPTLEYPNDKNLNSTMVNQWNEFLKNSEQLKDIKFPKGLPVLSFIASEQIDSVKNMIKSGSMKTSWESINEQMITNPNIQKVIPLDGTHYLHHTQSKTIALNINLLLKDKTTADETKKCLYANNLV